MKFPLTALAVMFMLCSCDVHQFPEELSVPEDPEGTRTVAIELDFTIDLPLHTVIDYAMDGGTSSLLNPRSSVGYEMRHTVKIFDSLSDQRGQFISRAEPIYTFTLYSEPNGGADNKHRIEIDIPDGEYTVMVWSDYVDRDNGLTFYNADDFSSIVFADTERYEGSSEWRDAFCGEVHFTVNGSSDATTGMSGQNIIVPMERPLARLTVISTDVSLFLNNLAKSAADSQDKASTKSTDLSDFYARIIYTGYLPSKFNMFRNTPVSSSLGVYFASELLPIDDDNARIAFDYIMVNDTEAHVEAAIQILDRNDNIVGQSAVFSAPLKRSHNTEVRGRFLSSSAESGMGINPGFDGEYNIRIK